MNAVRSLGLIALAIAAFSANAVLLGSPGCSPTWLTVSAALCSFAPFFIGVQHAVALATAGALPSRAGYYEIAAVIAGALAIVLANTFAAQWASVCGLR